MSRTRLYKIDRCSHPQCINGGKEANHNDPRCKLNPDNDNKVFCSPECGRHYLANIDEIEKYNRLVSKIKTKKSRKADALAEAIYVLSGKKFDKETAKKIINKLDLSSPYLKCVTYFLLTNCFY